MVEGVQQGPVLVGTFFMVAEEYLTVELLYGFHPPRTVPWRTTCMVLQNPLS